MTEQKKYWLGFSLFPGIGPKRFFLLLNYFGSAQNIWQASENKLIQTGLSQKLVKRFVIYRKSIDLGSKEKELVKKKTQFITYNDKLYPQYLKEISSPPIGLYVKGRLFPSDKKTIAVVGTRKVTEYGKKVTLQLVKDLVANGFTIISGLARGVDGIAHKAALGNGGKTIAVLGSGVDVVYPPEHKALARAIIASSKGAVISEFPMGTTPKKGHFPARNRIVSGISLGVLIIEGARKSGTKITATCAANQGREVFAVPGPIDSSLSAGPADLIKEGAKLVTGIDDILEEFKHAI